jgi:hypothetical protein
MWYVLGIVRATTSRVDGAIDFGAPLRSMVYRDIAAIAAELPQWVPEAMDRSEVLRKLIAHQQTLEHLFERGVVLPARFGCVVDDVADVEALLRDGYPLLARTLEEIDGKAEMQLSVGWDPEQVLRAIARDDAQIRSKCDQQRAGDASVTDIGHLLAQQLEARRAALAAHIVERAKSACEHYVEFERPDDAMLLSCAFLVTRAAAGELEASLHQSDRELGGQLCMRLLAPMPPISFSSMVVRKIATADLDAAMRLFAVDADTTFERLRATHRAWMRRLHPDVVRGDGESFARVQAAFVLLKTLWEAGRNPFTDIDRDHCVLVDIVGAEQRFVDINAR